MQKLSAACRQYLQKDHAFYSGKVYYYDARINPIKAALANVVVAVMKWRMKDIGPGNVSWPEANR